MLQDIRDKSQGWFAWIVITVICFSFALWGIHYYLTQSSGPQYVAKVGGATITNKTFNLAYQQVRQQQALRQGGQINDPALEQKLKQLTLEQLIQTQAEVQAAQKSGFRIAPEQVTALLTNIPAFQQDGKFSPALYQRALSGLNYSNQDFMQQLNQEMLASQIQSAFIGTAFSLPKEVNNAIKLVDQKRDVGYVVIPSAKFKHEVTVPYAKVEDYYKANKEQYEIPEMVKIEYIELSSKNLAKEMHFSNAEISDYYNKHKDLFTKDGQTQPLEAVKSKVSAIMAQRKAEKLYAEDSEKLANLTYENPESLKPASNALGLQVKTSDFFPRTGGETGITKVPEVAQAAFSDDVMKQNYNSDVITINDGQQVVVRLKTHKPVSYQPIHKVEGKIRNQLIKDAAQKRAASLGDTLVKRLKEGASGPELVKQYDLTWQTKANITRHQEGINSNVLAAVFKLPKPSGQKHPSATTILLPNGDVAVAALTKVSPGDPKQASKQQRDAFKQELAKQYGQFDYKLYLKGVMEQIKVKRNPAVLNTTDSGADSDAS
ncbi:MAG: hypothetical protein CMF50_03920 [Legionellales bacterium]|nr:hypothetical protein [Legionellales bacterium]|tara:strand:+ start:9213 stop:10850 length:1638 start_codon:yes stop_codon:yes gene_type:complete